MAEEQIIISCTIVLFFNFIFFYSAPILKVFLKTKLVITCCFQKCKVRG